MTSEIQLNAAIDRARDAIELAYPHANDLCRAVGVSATADHGTEAEKWLLSVRDNLLENLDRILTADYPQDEVHELESTPISTYAQWQVWTELKLWQFDPDVAVCEAGEFRKPYPSYSTEFVRAIKLSDLHNLAQNYEYEISSNALCIMLQEALYQNGEDDAE